MRIEEVGFSNYKPFEKSSSYRIHPVTILFGKNRAGKSAAARFPLLLALSMTGDYLGPLNLDTGEAYFGDLFTDIVHNNNSFAPIEIRIQFSEGFSLGLVLRYAAQIGTFVEEASYKSVNPEGKLKLKLIPNSKSDLSYSISFNETEYAGEIRFDGIFPELKEEAFPDLPEEFIQLLERAAKSCKRVSYIGPFRKTPRKDYSIIQKVSLKIGYLGDDYNGRLVPHILRQLHKEDDPRLDKIQGFYKTHFDGWYPDVDEQVDTFKTVLVNPENPRVRINLKTVGEGISQILPIVAKAYLSEAGSIDIIEQPELHLHPAAHGPLADLLVDSAKKHGNRFIVETHSENFLLRLRRRIAEEQIDPQDIGLYYVKENKGQGSEIIHIPVNDMGEVEFWPEGIFEEDFYEAAALMKAQNEREDEEEVENDR